MSILGKVKRDLTIVVTRPKFIDVWCDISYVGK